MSHILQRSVVRFRRLWLTEVLLVAAILCLGGFALLSDARLTPSEMVMGLNQMVAR